MSAALLGRGLVLAGIVAGLLAVGLPSVSSFGVETRYVDDGTAAAFLITLLALTSLLPAEIGRDLPAACAGSAAFGFFLVIPAVFAFDSLGGLDAGAWLGLCTALIPIGALIVLTTEGTRNSSARIDRGPGLLAATVGLVLIAVGIWLDVGRHGQSYWNASSSGHAVGLVLIVLVVTNAVLLAAAAHSSAPVGHGLVLVATVTFGFVVSALVIAAFGAFGTLGAGAWVEAAGGTLLLVGVVLPQLVRSGAAAPNAEAVVA